MRLYFLISYLFVTTLIGQTAIAQSNCVVTFGSFNIQCIEEDANFLWFGTKNKGLIRFHKQSHSLTSFDSTNSVLTSNNIISLLYYKNELIISTNSQLSKVVNGMISSLNDTIQGKLSQDLEENLIVADCRANIKNDVYFLKSDTLVRTVTLPDSHFPINFSDVAVGSDGAIWLLQNVFYNVDIYKISNSGFEVFNNNNADFRGPNPFGNSIEAFDNEILVALIDGVYSFDVNWQLKFQNFDYDDNLWITNGVDTLKKTIESLDFDTEGRLWFGSGSDGYEPQIAFYKNDKWCFIPKVDSTPSNVRAISLSKFDSQTVFVATTKGLQIIDMECLKNYSDIAKNQKRIYLTVFPNPSQAVLKIKTHININGVRFQIINSEGKQLKKGILKKQQINIANLKKGRYILKIDTELGSIKEVFIKE